MFKIMSTSSSEYHILWTSEQQRTGIRYWNFMREGKKVKAKKKNCKQMLSLNFFEL
jgi:hypothetical protein